MNMSQPASMHEHLKTNPRILHAHLYSYTYSHVFGAWAHGAGVSAWRWSVYTNIWMSQPASRHEYVKKNIPTHFVVIHILTRVFAGADGFECLHEHTNVSRHNDICIRTKVDTKYIYIYTYIYIYIVYTYKYVYIHIYIYSIYIYIHIYIYNIYLCIYIHIESFLGRIHMYTLYIYMYMYISVYVCIYTWNFVLGIESDSNNKQRY